MEYKIHVGKSVTIKSGLLSIVKILYCGMPNDRIFTLSPLTNIGNAGYSPNIYYDIETMDIHIADKVFNLIEVTPRYIVFTDNIAETNKEYV